MAEPDGSHGSPVATRTGGGFLVSLVAGGGGPDLPRGSPRRQNGAVWRPLDPPIGVFNPTGAEGPRPQPKAPLWSPHTYCRQGCRLRWVVGLKDTQKVPLAPREFGQGAKCAISTITCSLCGPTASWQQKKATTLTARVPVAIVYIVSFEFPIYHFFDPPGPYRGGCAGPRRPRRAPRRWGRGGSP